MPTPIVIIRGIPGSGKTWICREIQKTPGVVCFDVDDIYTLAYDQLAAKNANTSHDSCSKETVRLLESGISRAKADANVSAIVITSGVRIPFDPPAEKLFIGLSAATVKVAYRRVIRRQVNAWQNTPPPGNLEGEDLSDWVRAHHLMALNPTIPLERYRKIYMEVAAEEQKKGFKIMSQANIVKRLKLIAS